ncbi:cytochrome c oxidase subunit II [Halomarina ordinaria]|uniref:Cytochrome c oxidase subunit II n=1 Tax=Halomarina ordinaria TaxID=3033939 RepID=A0ABD5U347_9EURY|nr:cytochrome c oxidase subunit II [Halomarina sp. PSRA2]
MYRPNAGVFVQLDGLVPRGTRTSVFSEIYWVFLLLGTLVGVVVVGYMLYNAYRYRDGADRADDGDAERPRLGELPSGGGKGRKLFLSFAISAVIVVSLVLWTYGTLLFIERPGTAAAAAGDADGEVVEIEVVGRQFIWEFVYPNGHTTTGELRVPEDTQVRLAVTSADVFHNFGVPALRAKADAIPGQTTETWFVADRPGEYEAHCYELCGAGHSEMKATVVVMERGEYEEWYAGTEGDRNATGGNETSENATSENATNAGASVVAAGGERA